MGEFDTACHTACFILMMLVFILSIISIAEPWWLDTGVVYTTIMTLWSVRLTGNGADTTKSWDTLCETWSHDWCSKIKASRAFVIMTMAFGLASALCYAVVIRKPEVRSASFVGLGLMFVTFVSTIIAFGLGLYYPGFSSFDKPQTGFMSISVAFAFTFVSMVSGARGAFAVRGYTRFEDTKAGKSKRSEKTASFDTSGCFRLNSEGQLKWTPKASIDNSVTPSDVERPSNDNVDPPAVDSPSDDNAVKSEV